MKGIIAARANRGAARPRAGALLTGFFVCSSGRPARFNGISYACRCALEGQYHPGGQLRRGTAEELALRLLVEAFAALPDTRAPKRTARQTHDTGDALTTLRVEIGKKQKELTSLRAMEATFLRAGTREGFAETLRALTEEIACLEAKHRAESQAAAHQARDQAMQQLAAVKRAGFATVWETADVSARRALLGLIIERLEIVAPDVRRGHVRQVRVVVQPWIAPFYDPQTVLTRRFRRQGDAGTEA